MRHFKPDPKHGGVPAGFWTQTRKNKLHEKSKGSPPFADIHLIRPQRSRSRYWRAAPDLDVADSSGQNGSSRHHAYYQGPYSNTPYSSIRSRTWAGSPRR